MTLKLYLPILLYLVKEKIKYAREEDGYFVMRGDLAYWRDLKKQIVKDLKKEGK